MTSADKHHIVVIGAGVIGLTTAVALAEKGFKVTIISKDIPGDFSDQYASPWAGAHWRSHAPAHELEQCDWDLQSYDYFVDLMEDEKRDVKLPRSGIKMYPSLHFWDGPIALDELWWAPYVKDFAQTPYVIDATIQIHQRQETSSSSSGPAPQISQSASCLAPAINVPHYLAYLRDRALRSGAILFQSSLPVDGGLQKALATADGISNAIGRGKVDAYVNATGLGARDLCGDEAVYPIRGQTVLVRGEATAIRTRTGAASKDGREAYTAYCIPRPGSGTTILGGTRDVGAWDTTPDPAITEVILERAGYMVPELLTGAEGGFEVVSVQCGLRPARRGGPRTEREVLGDGRRVVHAYGFAGAGYQNSVGVARKTVRNVRLSLGLDVVEEEERGRRRPSAWLPASRVPSATSAATAGAPKL